MGLNTKILMNRDECQPQKTKSPTRITNNHQTAEDATKNGQPKQDVATNDDDASIPISHEPCTKPDYLSQKVRYNAANTARPTPGVDRVRFCGSFPQTN